MIEKTHRGLNKSEYIYINLYGLGSGANIFIHKSSQKFVSNILIK